MFRLGELTLARGRNGCGTGGGDGVPSCIFPYSIKRWCGLQLSLTCRQGEFADNISVKGMRRKRQGQVGDTAIRQMHTKSRR
jgi:hypothetical protein